MKSAENEEKRQKINERKENYEKNRMTTIYKNRI